MGRNEKLQRLGRVLHISLSGKIILKAENLPHIGDKVLDEKLRPIGEVFDIFGPVSTPYIAVKAERKENNQLINKILYFTSSRPRRRKK